MLKSIFLPRGGFVYQRECTLDQSSEFQESSEFQVFSPEVTDYIKKHLTSCFFQEDLKIISRDEFKESETTIDRFGSMTSPYISSENYSKYSDAADIELIVLHNTVCDLDSAFKVLRVNNGTNSGNVSANFLIGLSGMSYELVDPEEGYAWHAGNSSWLKYDKDNQCMAKVKDASNLNKYSIGIEVVNSYNPNYVDNSASCFRLAFFTDDQIDSINSLCNELLQAYPNAEICTHSEIAFSRKIDPMQSFAYEKIEGVTHLSGNLYDRLLNDLMSDQLSDLESRNVIFEYNDSCVNSYDDIFTLRCRLMFLGYDIPLLDDYGVENRQYDKNLARACLSFKINYLGIVAPDLSIGENWEEYYFSCNGSDEHNSNYFNDGFQLNLDWQNAADWALQDIVANKEQERGVKFDTCIANTLDKLYFM